MRVLIGFVTAAVLAAGAAAADVPRWRVWLCRPDLKVERVRAKAKAYAAHR